MSKPVPSGTRSDREIAGGSSRSDSAPGESPASARALSARRRFPPISVWVVVALCALAIVLVRGFVDLPKFDGAVRNIITLILSFVALMTLLVWFAWRSAYSRGVRLAPVVLAMIAIAAVAATRRIDSFSGGLVPSSRWRWEPKPDQSLPQAASNAEVSGVDLLTTTPDDFPQFLGPRRNATVEGIRLARDWKAQPPELRWRHPIGAGWSAFSVVGNHAVTLEQRGGEELVSCYDRQTGQLEWADGIRARHESTLGGVGPRSTPTIHQGKVYALGGTGVLRCLDGATGRRIWTHDLLKEFGVAGPEADMAAIAWGRAASPLVVDNKVVVPAGGPSGGPFVSLVAYELETGDEIWRGGDFQVGYASPSLFTLGGRRQIVMVNEANITGHDPETGKVLWEHPWPGTSNAEASASQTVPIDEKRLFVSKGYGGGAMLFEVTQSNGTWKTSEIWHNPRSLQTKFANVVCRDGYLYGLSDGILECIDVEHGKRQWKKGRYGHGQILLVGDLILVLGETGELALIEANPQKYVELGQIQALEGKTWNNLTLVGPSLLIRNGEEAACYRLPLAEPGRRGEGRRMKGEGIRAEPPTRADLRRFLLVPSCAFLVPIAIGILFRFRTG